jgi:hypothetical protein
VKKHILLIILILHVVIDSGSEERKRTIEEISYDISRHPNNVLVEGWD